MSPKPGPTFEIADAAAEIQVIKSRPLKDNNKADAILIAQYFENTRENNDN